MYWCKKIYYGERALENQKELLKNLKRKKWSLGVYVITLPENDKNLLDIFETIQFEQPAFRKKKLTVVGIAIGKDEAFTLVQEIVQDVHNLTGGFGIKEYFLEDKE